MIDERTRRVLLGLAEIGVWIALLAAYAAGAVEIGSALYGDPTHESVYGPVYDPGREWLTVGWAALTLGGPVYLWIRHTERRDR